jgi:hypothetical protein
MDLDIGSPHICDVMTVVRAHYRYKRPPRKRMAVALDVPRGEGA